jgi:hypothetical protein
MRRAATLCLVTGLLGGLLVGVQFSAIGAVSDARVAVWLEVAQRICTSVGGLGTLFALVFVILQFKLLRTQLQFVQRNTAAAISGQLYARLDNFNKFIVEHDKEYEMLNSPFHDHEPAESRSRLHHLCDLGFTFYEEIYKHHVRYDLLDTEDWEEWQQNMTHFFSKPYVRGYWKTTASRYAKTFQAFAAGLVTALEPALGSEMGTQV